ncbi:unnamed protein product [Peronospora belbahrii]|uniref:Uncharacterized protein n=1 Tax=Peronospora belbahrii TaxID=622444 RepID=A0ABN8CLW5_9STRA|nr:unnamed protein product [Peronospora belbahrii]
MFKGMRALFRRRLPMTSLCDSTGKYSLSRQEAGTKIFLSNTSRTSSRTPARRRRRPSTPLKNRITAYELERAFRRLRNGRAPDADFIPAELLKYGSELPAQPLADIIN